MKIDAQNGRVELPELGLVISPADKRSEFLASQVGQSARINVHNGPWCSWYFGTVTVEGTVVTFTLFFYEEEVQMLSLDFYRSEWESSSEDRMLLEKHEAVRLLAQVWMAPPKSYSWGTIYSGLDPKSGHASTGLSYTSYLQRFRKPPAFQKPIHPKPGQEWRTVLYALGLTFAMVALLSLLAWILVMAKAGH